MQLSNLQKYFTNSKELHIWLNKFNKTLWSRPIDALAEGREQEVCEVAAKLWEGTDQERA
jgi:hypothetical protein